MQVQSLSQEDPLEEGMVTTQEFLPGEFHGQWSLAGYNSTQSHKELDMIEATEHLCTPGRACPESTAT